MVCIEKNKKTKNKKTNIFMLLYFPSYIDISICFDFLTEPTGESANTASSPSAGIRTILLNFVVLTNSTLSLLLRFLRLGVRFCLLNISTLPPASRVFYSKEKQKRLKNKAASFIYITIRLKEMFCLKILKDVSTEELRSSSLSNEKCNNR